MAPCDFFIAYKNSGTGRQNFSYHDPPTIISFHAISMARTDQHTNVLVFAFLFLKPKKLKKFRFGVKEISFQCKET